MKHLLTILSILLLSSPLFGQETGVLYLYETSSGIQWKTFGDGKVQPKYKGEIKNGKMDGLGVLTYPYGGKSVVGEWKNGKEWNTKHTNKDGKLIGGYKKGKLVVERKPRQFKPCKVSITLHDGKLFEGNFEDEKLDEQINGKGTLTYPSGRNYNGEWENGVFHGQGTYTSPDVSTYVGEWKDGKRDGQGTLTYPSGRNYDGEWKNGKEHGQGTYSFPNGSKFEGEFRDGKWWNGAEYDKNGNITGKWVNGEIHK